MFLRPLFKVVVSPSWRRKRKETSLLWWWIGWQHFCWTDLLGSSRQTEKRSRRQKQQWTCFVKKNYPKIAGQLVENGRSDFFFLLRLKFLARRFQDDVTRGYLQRRFLANLSVTTLLRHCFECFPHRSNIAMLCCIPCALCYEPYLSKVVAMPTGL